MKIIGLTGGVGSGKSTVAEIMKQKFHAHIIIADQVGHLMMQKDNPSYKLIINHFGEEILDENMEIDRKKLSNIVFEDSIHAKEQLEILNSFIHPYVKEYIFQELKQIESKDKDSIVVIETAILLEAGYRDLCNEIWYVSTSEQIRRDRLKKSRNYTDEKIDSIIMNQLSEQEFLKYSTRIVYNNGDVEKIVNQIKLMLV